MGSLEAETTAGETKAAAEHGGAGPFPAPLSRESAGRLADVLKAVSDPTRLQLLSMIAASPGGEANVNDLTAALKLTQPTVSHHLKTLVGAGLLSRSKRGKWAWYSIRPDRLDVIRGLLS
ncbi:ArsR/SmtB family transcription factor [Allonocardiopsis opalescens]|uniref:ArsR/SmtB family transcription factor n=1 Tax=Allonocardiopsis opalescens TaxID=1144618 RepID=UPI001B7FFAAF|nr:metalloregulator ArsR/SmtB family transcription factor [Allonocardiopsis opalescens]